MALWQVLGFVLLIPLLFVLSGAVVGAVLLAARLLRRTPAPAGAAGQWTAPARRPATFILTLVFHRLAVMWLGMPVLYRLYYDRVIVFLLFVGLFWLLARLIDALNTRLLARVLPAGAAARGPTLSLAPRALKLVAFLLVVLLALAAFGVNLTATLAGLGIGGIALAFAAQKSLENLFGGIAILADKGLAIGDTCRIGAYLGEIEDITLWATRVRTQERTVVSIPNGQMSASQIENLTRRDKFWFHPTVGLVYQTTAEQMRQVLESLRRMLAADPRVEAQTARARFRTLGASSLDVEVFAYVRAATFPEFLAIQEELLLRVLEAVEAAGTSVAFPSQTVYLRGAGPSEPGPR
jgi:MscS family membrane protein